MSGMEPFLLAAGTAMSAVGAIQQGNASKAAANYNAQVMERNAQIARQQGEAKAEQANLEHRRRMGAQRAKGGGSMNFLDVYEDSERMAKLNELNLLYSAELEATGAEASAQGERTAGKSAQKSGYMGAASSLLSGSYTAQKDYKIFSG